MSTIINCSIDVKMISKDKIKIHSNGSHYWNFSVMERKEPDQYGNTHYVVEGQSKEDREAKAEKNYLKSSGKAYVFGGQNNAETQSQISNPIDDEEDELPF